MKFLFYALLIIFLSCQRPIPLIESIEPDIIRTGDDIHIKGQNLGSIENSTIKLDGIPLDNLKIKLWSNTEIVFTLNSSLYSGILSIHNGRYKSNNVLLPLAKNLLQKDEYSMYANNQPLLELLEPATASLGELIKIKGNNYGDNSTNPIVYFSKVLNNETFSFAENDLTKFVRAEILTEMRNNEIVVMVPLEAVTGPVFVKNNRGVSNSAFFELRERAGTQTYSSYNFYKFNQELLLEYAASMPPASKITLVLNSPINNNRQKIQSYNLAANLTSLNNKDIFSTSSLTSPQRFELRSFEVLSRALTAKITKPELSNSLGETSPIYQSYTAASSNYPSTNSSFVDLAYSLTRNTYNFYTKALALYEFIYANIDLDTQENPDVLSLEEYLIERHAPPWEYLHIFVTLCRSIGIPTRIANGIKQTGDKFVEAYWAVLFLPNFGWINVLPIEEKEEAHNETNEEFKYFGHIPANYIQFAYNNSDNYASIFNHLKSEADSKSLINKLIYGEVKFATATSALKSTWINNLVR